MGETVSAAPTLAAALARQIAPAIPVFPTKFAKGWPEHPDAPRVVYATVDQAMSTVYDTDAHYSVYSVPEVPRRLATPEVFAELSQGLAMVLFVVDVDGPEHAGGDEWWAVEKEKIDRLLVAHSGGYVYRTRGGYRIVYQLAAPVVLRTTSDAEQWKLRYVAWIEYLKTNYAIGGDQACKDWTRLYRFPRVMRDGRREDREAIGDPHAIGTWDVAVEISRQTEISTDRATNNTLTEVGALTHGQRHPKMLELAGAMRRKGADESTILTALTTFNAQHCAPPKPMADIRGIATFVCSKVPGATSPNREPPPADPDDETPRTDGDPPPRPEIVLSTDQPTVADKAIHALKLMGGVYVRGRQLVHVVRDQGAPDWFQRPTGSPVIVPIERDHLLDLLGRAAVWVSMKEGIKHAASPPCWVAARILARGQWPLPQLEAISDAPVFRADGSVQDKPGYDEQTRVIFDPCGDTFPTIPEHPSRADAQRALGELEEPFAEFPFLAASDRAAAVAFVLSPIARPAIPGNVPMFGIRAPTPGSGKGLLADVAAMIPTGRRAPLMAPTEEDEETRKRLLAIAMESPPIVVIDNVDCALGSPSLAMALTAGQVSDRLLGSTRMVTASLRPVWAFTGNNVQLKGDLGRRVVPIDLDPKVEHPEDRTFERSDLLGYVRQHRPRLAVAALTLLRAFVVAGRPSHGMPTKGSFEAWDHLIRGAIIWAGGADPLGGVQRIRDRADDDLDRLRALLAAWHAQLGGVQHTIADLIKLAGTSGDLHDALAAYCRSGKPEAKPIGYAFRKVHGRPAGRLVLRRDAADRNGIALWMVQPCQ
jgi:hypothetical protein